MRENNNMADIVYEFEGSLYINLTNRCSNDCDFCIRNIKNGVGGGRDLWLADDPDAAHVKTLLDGYDLSEYSSVVFCGFGEPTCALSVLLDVAHYLKERGAATRINTNGQANLINGIDNVPQLLAPCIDTVSVSLNASDAEKYQQICHCVYGEKGFAAMIEFTRQCVAAGIDTVMSVVDCIGEKEVKACAEVAKSTGARFRVRKTVHAEDEY